MARCKSILLVDDDRILREALVEQLAGTGEFAIDEAENGAKARGLASTSIHDLIILDVGLPDIDGRELCRVFRRQGIKTPILMLTDQDSDADTILDRKVGANDYITKPFRLMGLLARIHAQMRQHEQSEEAVLRIGPYAFRPSMKVLVDDNQRTIHLTAKEAGILEFLHRSPDRLVTRNVLLQKVWGYHADVTTHTLETHIYRLRRKIEADPSNARILVTESGGYRLNA